ncbi:MAG: DUF1772 domain-containing protein [Acidobacteria bacterium]|nr:DUF1772 domain-containing protein [Acidobacteriota bacterium]
MKRKLLILNHSLLLLCVSMYVGTGWSLVLFSFPAASQLTPDNYYSHFVPQVEAATRFFTYMTGVMIVCALIMIVAERKERLYRWFPIIVLVGVIVATLLTTRFIFPYNEAMREGITDPAQLRETLGKWMSLNKVRVSLWTVQWLSMMSYFGIKTYRGEKSR